MCVVDLGAAPGGWSQYAARRLEGRGCVLAVDLLPMDPLPHVTTLQVDFSTPEGLEMLSSALAGCPVDLVMSDMAPNLSGMRSVDQPRAMALAELALDLVERTGAPGGDLLVKLFQGAGVDEFFQACRARFGRVYRVKPRASRAQSREFYLLARGLQRPADLPCDSSGCEGTRRNL